MAPRGVRARQAAAIVMISLRVHSHSARCRIADTQSGKLTRIITVIRIDTVAAMTTAIRLTTTTIITTTIITRAIITRMTTAPTRKGITTTARPVTCFLQALWLRSYRCPQRFWPAQVHLRAWSRLSIVLRNRPPLILPFPLGLLPRRNYQSSSVRPLP